MKTHKRNVWSKNKVIWFQFPSEVAKMCFVYTWLQIVYTFFL